MQLIGNRTRGRIARERSRAVAFLSIAAAILAGCSGKAPVREVTPQELLARAERRIENEDYLEAIELLTKLTVDYPGVAYIDRVVYQLGRAHLEAGTYPEAEAQFRRLVRDYPFSDLADDAAFLVAETPFRQRGDPWVDPTHARDAHDAFRRFLRDHPDSELVPEARRKLGILDEWFAEKTFNNARQYRTLGKPRSAAIYFRNVFARHPDSALAPAALIQLAEVRHELDQDEDACEALRLLRELPASDALDEALVEAVELESEYGCAAAETTAGTPRGASE